MVAAINRSLDRGGSKLVYLPPHFTETREDALIAHVQ
jgi:hypothetical protein